jgi:replicative DNA helicase
VTDAVEHGKIVLAGMIAARGSTNTEVLDWALRHVKPEYLTDRVQRGLFGIIENYAAATGGVLTRQALIDSLRNEDPGVALMYGEAYDALTRVSLSEDQFKHSCTQLRELTKWRRTADITTTGMKILRQGETVGDAELRGADDARAYMLSALADVDRLSIEDESPEGDIRHEQHEVMLAYAAAQAARAQGQAPGIKSGIDALDRKLGGSFIRNGQVGLIAGYTSVGKTAFCCQLAWDAAVNQGKNVVYFTTETARSQVRIKLYARHSRLARFGLPNGLNTRDITEGTLNPDELAAFQASLQDMDANPGYGVCYVVQMPSKPTVGMLESRLSLIGRHFLPDLVIADYLQLFYPGRARDSLRVEQADVIKEAKSLSISAFGGRGFPLVSPWQISRAGRQQLKTEGNYSYEALSETHEAPQTADIILSLEDQADTSQGRSAPLDLVVMKNRDGERGGSVRLVADYANACFSGLDRSGGNGNLFDVGS